MKRYPKNKILEKLKNRFKKLLFVGNKIHIFEAENKSLRPLTNDKPGSNQKIEEYFDELKEKQSQLVHTEKLTILGELTSSIMHELNNPIMVVLGYSGELKEVLKNKNHLNIDEVEKCVDRITMGVDKIKHMVDHVRDFSRTSNQKLIETDLNDVINKAFMMVEKQLYTDSVKIVKELQSPLPTILGDPNELEQVIINLLINANDSMKDQRRENPAYLPELVVHTRTKGDGAEIIIRDNGKGISPDVKENIFKPFFTTKEVGKGTGLGLSISHKIITKHGANISVDSTPGAGASFTISFKPTGKTTDVNS